MAVVEFEESGHRHGEGLGRSLEVAGVDGLDGDVVAVAVCGLDGDVDVLDKGVGAGLPAGDLLAAVEGDAQALVRMVPLAVNRAPSAWGSVPFQAAAQAVTVLGRRCSAGCTAEAVVPIAAQTAVAPISAVVARAGLNLS
ncbi:hypothetical protein [Streptomyces sp. NPDC005209]|uniref:hypothetical protein n=1 Tax=Streptomyces sp. NPDC005209 TaxID=3156715 RepID=UPI0033A7BB53